MALVKGKFIDPSLPIQQSQDPAAGDDVARKSYVDTKSEGDAAAAQSAAELYAAGAASAAQSAAEDYADAGLALKQNSLGTGTLTQYLRGDLTWQEVITSSPVAQIKYVSKNGVDASADGSEEKPYLTITAAMASITDATPSKRYVIRIAAGNYTEAAVAIKANVFLVGDSKESVRITGAVSMNADFNQPSSQDCRSGASMVTFLSAADFNWQTVTSPAGKLYFNEVVFGSTVNMYGHNNAIAQAQFNSCIIFGNLTISGINVGVFSNNICYSNITLNQHPNGGMASILMATGGYCGGTVRFNTTVNDFGRRSAGFLRGFTSENLIIDGISSYADVDLVSQGKSSTQKLNSGNLVALNPRVSHDLETQMLKPLSTNSHNLGDWGKQYLFNFAYVQGSSGTDLYLLSTMESYNPAGDTGGKSIFIQSDAYGLQTDVSGGNIELETAAVTGTGVRGKVQVKARELDMTSAKITNLADGVASSDAVNKGQLDSAAAAAQSAAEAAANAYTDLKIGDLEGQPDVVSVIGLAAANAVSAAEGYTDSKIENQIVEGVTDKAPSQDAVYQAIQNAVQAADQSPHKESHIMTAQDILDGYVDLSKEALANSMLISISGTVQYEGEDYTLSTVGGVTRVTLAGELAAAIAEGDKLHFQYWAPLEI